MKKLVAIAVTTAMVLPVMTGCGAVTLPDETETETTAAESGPADPKEDFYRYINEDWLNNAEFEYGETSVRRSFNQKKIDDEIEGIIDDVVAGSGYAKGSEEDLIKRAYELYTAYDFENGKIPSDLMNMINEVSSCDSVEELMDCDAKLVRDYGLPGLLSLGVDIDPFDPEERIMTFGQISGVLNTTFVDMRDMPYAADAIKNDCAVILKTRDIDKESAEQCGTELAYIAMDLYTNTDLAITEDPMSFQYQEILSKAQVNEMFSNVDLDRYVETVGYDTSLIGSYSVTDVKQLQALNGIFKEEYLNALKAWELGSLYGKYSQYIAPSYTQLSSLVDKSYKSLHDRAVDEISVIFKSETDPLYVERYYTPGKDKALRDMCDDIRAGYRDLISGADWLSKETRDELLRKLENIVYVTGTDLERHDTAEYKDLAGNNYYEFCLNYQRHDTQKMIESLGQPVSRQDIFMPMQMCNACYNPSFNNITITAAITNAPFFDIDADYYTNLGALGMVIAHEMGHAFDSDCILFNSRGEYDPSWIPENDMNTLLARNEKAARYFEDNFTVFGIYHVDGEQTLGENYADLGAVECITSLAKTKEDRISLFESYALIWGNKSVDEAIINQIAYDSHSPSQIRVNAVLSSIDDFYETYGIKEGDGMYIAPEDRVSRWY